MGQSFRKFTDDKMMAKITFILCILISFSLHASSDKYAALIQSARDFELDGKTPEAKKAYEKAWALKTPDTDKLPLLVELVKLHRDDKESGLRWVIETEKWLAAHPDQKEKFDPWIKTMRGYVTGNLDPQSAPAFMKTFVIDKKLPSLISEKKFPEAWTLVKDRKLAHADLRSQVVHDVLAAVAVKDKSRKNFCEASLKRHPSSQAWTIRVCSYLENWKKNKSDKELMKSIVSQIREEEPKSSYLSHALEEL